MNFKFTIITKTVENLRAGGRPSTWFPPGGHVEHDAIVELLLHMVKKCHVSDDVKIGTTNEKLFLVDNKCILNSMDL